MGRKTLLLFFISTVLILSISLISAVSITGTIMDSLSAPIPGATVEAWSGDTLINLVVADGSGNYDVTGLTGAVAYDIRAFSFTNLTNRDPSPAMCWDEDYSGYYPQTQNIVAPLTGINFNLNSIPEKGVDILYGVGFGRYWGVDSIFGASSYLFRKGDVITTKDTQGNINGIGINCWDYSANQRGDYLVDAQQDDVATSGIDEGSLPGEDMTFYVNTVLATNTSGTRQWSASGGNTEISTSGAAASCQFTNAYWDVASTTIGNIVNPSFDSNGCVGEVVSFVITEVGISSQGLATIQPGVASVGFLGTNNSFWTAEWVDDSAGGDSNPPEYSFEASIIGQPEINMTSGLLQVFQDTTPPVISNPNVVFFGDNVIITWDTDELATTQVDYGLDTSYGTSIIDLTLVLNHMAVIPNVNLDTTYFYRLVSNDSSANTNNSVTSSFSITGPSVTITLQEGINGYYFGTKDTYLYSQTDVDLGGMSSVRLGQRLATGDLSHPIFWFDTSPLGSSANIISATLDLNYYVSAEGTSSVTGSLYEILTPWGAQGTGSGTAPIPGIVTWNYSIYNTTLWGVPGADGTTGGGGSSCSDVTGDTRVNIFDLAIVLASQGQSGPEYSHLDFDSSGIIDLGDITQTLSQLGTSCVPGIVGIDRDTVVQDSITFTSATSIGWYSWNLNPILIQNWIDTPVSNFGFVMKAPNIGVATRYYFRSSEFVTQTERPRLVITYN